MYIAYHDKSGKLHIIQDTDDKYLSTWGTNDQITVYVRNDKVYEEYGSWTPEEPHDDTWTTTEYQLGTFDFKGSDLGQLMREHKEWFLTLMEQTNE